MASSQGDDEEEVFDDEVLETLKLIKERAANSNDIIDYCLVKVGEPAIDEKKKKHPTYEVSLYGKRGTSRTRSFRFGPLRTFDAQCRGELGNVLKEPFPANSIMSKIGSLSEADMQVRAQALEKWLNDVLRNRQNMSPILQQATAHILQLGEHQLFTDIEMDSDDDVDERGATKENTEPIFKSGYMLKRGKVNTSYKKRFFVLDPATSTFLYFDSEKTYEKYAGDDDMDSSVRSGSISLSQSISSSFSFRRISMSVSGHGSSSSNRESMSLAGDQGPLGSILLPGATLEHVAGSKDFIVRTSESSYPLRAQSGAEAGDWAAAIRANVLAASRSVSRSNHGTTSAGGDNTNNEGGFSSSLLGGEYAEVNTLLKTVGLESYAFRVSVIPNLKPGVSGLAQLKDQELKKHAGMKDSEIIKLRKAIEKLDLNSTEKVASSFSNPPPPQSEKSEDDIAADFMKELEDQEKNNSSQQQHASSVVDDIPFMNLARKALQANPRNLTARAILKDESVSKWVNALDPVSFAKFYACVKSGLEVPQAMIGTYVHNGSDYDEFKPVFDRIITDYHRKKPQGNIHRINDDTWTINLGSSNGGGGGGERPSKVDQVMDFRSVGVVKPVFMVISTVRNFSEFPFPAGMTLSQRLKFERSLSVGLCKLSSKYGGTICSLTPAEFWHKNLESNQSGPPAGIVPCSYSNYLTTLKRGFAKYVIIDPLSTSTPQGAQFLHLKKSNSGKAGAMLGGGNGANDPIMNDPFNASATNKVSSLNSDWPVGRGVFVSKDGGIVVRYGFEDHLSVTVSNVGFIMSDLFSSLREMLSDLCKNCGFTFASHASLGYLTSSPSNLGTSMVAEVRGLDLPHYCKKFTGNKITNDALEFGLDVKFSKLTGFPGSEGMSSSIGGLEDDDEDDEYSSVEVDISVVRKLFIKESDIARRIYMYVQKLNVLNTRYDPVVLAAKAEKERQEALVQQTASKLAAAAAEKEKTLAEFKEMLENGVEVVKFNRRGKVAFRTLLLVGDHTLTWRAEGKGGASGGGSGALKKSASSASKSKMGDLFDLRQLSFIQLGEEPENGVEGAEKGTPTLRLHVSKHKDILSMVENGQCCSLVFKERSIDFGLDCLDQRDLISQGFKLLVEELTKTK